VAHSAGGWWEVAVNGGQLTEEEHDGAVPRGVALVGGSGVEVMVHVEDVEGVPLPG
jgi:hypothetical protein